MQNVVRYIVVLAVATVVLQGCAALPKEYAAKADVVKVLPGPEDAVLDTITTAPRLLISCDTRRDNEPDRSEILSYDIATKTQVALKRIEPAGLIFHPHGIDLVQVKDTLILLVVSHDNQTPAQQILRYRVYKDSLVFLTRIVDPLIVSPNAITGLSDGSILISNDAGKKGSIAEMLFKLKRCRIIHWDGNKCSIAAEKFCYGNGITVHGSKVYYATTLQNKVFSFDYANGKLVNKQVLAKVKGPDNLRIDGNNLIVACHLRFIKFIKHVKHTDKHTPSTIYSINENTGAATTLFYDDGQQIDASSTGLIYKDKLYIVGVFDADMAVVEMKK